MGIPIQRLQKADQVLGRVACLLLQPLRLVRRSGRPAGACRRVLLIKFWGIGSVQLLGPAVRALREREPQAELTLLTLHENEAFARGLGLFDRVVTLDVSQVSWPGVFGRILRLLARLRSRRFDAVYDFEFFTRFSAVVTLASGASMAHGFASPTVWRGGFHTRTVPFNRYWHVSRNFRALAGGEDGTEVRPTAIPGFPVSDRERASLDAKLAARGVPPSMDLVVLNPNAGTLSLERRWPASSFAELGRRLADEADAAVVFIGARGEVDYTRHAAAAARTEGVFELAGELSIAELCALFERAAAVVSNDSGPMHLAAALGAPTLGLFGPETPVMYAPIGERARYLWRPPVCSPCINVHQNKVANCVRGRPECLVNLDVDRVYAEVRVLLEGKILHPFGPPVWRRAPTGTDGELDGIEERGVLEHDE